jgi:hypothetical protein
MVDMFYFSTYRVVQKNVYTLWHEKYKSVIVTTVFIQKQYDMRDVLEFWIQLYSHPEIEISFKFIPKLLMSKECIYFLGQTVFTYCLSVM